MKLNLKILLVVVVAAVALTSLQTLVKTGFDQHCYTLHFKDGRGLSHVHGCCPQLDRGILCIKTANGMLMYENVLSWEENHRCPELYPRQRREEP